MAKSTNQRSAEYRERKKERLENERLEQLNKHESWESWTAENRANNPPSVEALALHESCEDQLHFMNTNTANDLSFEEAVADLLDFVKQYGVAHVHGVRKNQSIPPNWAAQDKFWTDVDLIQKICKESGPTKLWVSLGLLSGLPDWPVIQFLRDKCGYSDADARILVGQKMTEDGWVYR